MSDRITRSATRRAKESNLPVDSAETPPQPVYPSKKRKVSSHLDKSPPPASDDPSARETPRRPKRQKTRATSHTTASVTPGGQAGIGERGLTGDTIMSNNGSSSRYTDESLKSSQSKSTSKQAGSRSSKKPAQDLTAPISTPTARRQRKRAGRKDSDESQKPEDSKPPQSTGRDKEKTSPPAQSPTDSNGAGSPGGMEDEDSNLFSAALFGASRGGSSGLSNTLRALSGVMSGMSARLRDILNNLRQIDNPTMQLVALEEFSNLLLVSNEDNLSGQFSPDPYVKELVALMQPNPLTGEENPEMMLLACRCIANLMEALRGSVANVVYGGAVPVLCQKLLDIQYIDVAEQALSTLSKVSIDFPASIVREGGLTACLQFLDFFATGTQRTAVTTAANCCRNIPHDSFPVIRDVMPILLNVLSSHDQKVVEQGCLCVTRVIDSFKHAPEKLEQLVDPALLRAILGLLLPGSTNMIGSYIHTEFLRVLAIVARASPRLSADLLKMNVVDTLYQILTGIAPPSDTKDVAAKIDSVMVMQALIRRPREQVFETLNVICELLPRPRIAGQPGKNTFIDDGQITSDDTKPGTTKGASKTRLRTELLEDCKMETRRFAMILLPTLTDAYSSTVNLNVRQKVLTAQLKILSNLDVAVIEEALRPVPYASFLASILSQEDHPSLVVFALQISQLLFERLEDIYQYQFQREGVVSEIKKLADRSLSSERKISNTSKTDTAAVVTSDGIELETSSPEQAHLPDVNDDVDDDDEDDDEDMDNDEADVEEDDREDENEDDEIVVTHDHDHDHDLDDSGSSDSSDMEIPLRIHIPELGDAVIMQAKHILENYQTTKGQELKLKAQAIRDDLKQLAKDIIANYDSKQRKPRLTDLFIRLASYFNGDAIDSITSSELLDSGIVRALLSVLSDKPGRTSGNPRGDFVVAFMQHANVAQIRPVTTASSMTAFTVLVQKLQDLLSRAEHFEVLTVHSNAGEQSRSSSASMLTKQLRLRLTAEGESDIPHAYREMIVSIHAIATFKALDDYLRPRFSLSDRPTSASRRRAMLQQLANARMAQLSGAAESGFLLAAGNEASPQSSPANTQSRTKPTSQERTNRIETRSSERAERKRSSRRNQGSSSTREDAEMGASLVKEPSLPLECADEKALDEGVENAPTSDSMLNTLVGALQEDDSDQESSEPSAINMEVAASGKVTARREDGTRIQTPHPPGTPISSQSRPLSSAQNAGSTPASANTTPSARPSSYAAALAAVPQDWHIEFSIDGKVIPNSTTIYRAVHHYRVQPQESPRGVWSGVHTVKFRKVKGPPPSESTITPTVNKPVGENGLPVSLNDHPITSSILGLLRILHSLNASLEEIRQSLSRAGLILHAEPPASFINTKLTAKMNRQLEEPLIVASNCLPDWSEDLARTFPLLFPFETRHLFLQSTSFGYSRSMMRWQNSQAETDDHRDRHRDERPILGRPQRQKVRISRSRILESAMKVMEMYGASPSVLEVEYFEEVGTGLGPTLEFYSTVSKEFSKKKIKMWRENDSSRKDEFAFGKNGLFPAPMSDKEATQEAGKKLLQFFSALGKFVARSMLDSRIIDVSFNALFFRMGSQSPPIPTIALLRHIDQDLANSLAQLQQFANAKINIEEDVSLSTEQKVEKTSAFTIRDARLEDLALDFTLPGYPAIELIDGGSNITVSMDNVQNYIDRVLDLSLGSGVSRQIHAFQTGFSQVFSYSSLQAFTSDELAMLFGRVDEDWSLETLMDSVKADHGFNMDSKSVKNLLHVMSELTAEQRRDFLQFVTGSPKLPIGGFKSLTPMFTVVCKPSEPPYTSDDYLPSVMTCVNYLKLPDYSNQEVLKKQLGTAIREGQGAFHLS